MGTFEFTDSEGAVLAARFNSIIPKKAVNMLTEALEECIYLYEGKFEKGTKNKDFKALISTIRNCSTRECAL